MAKEANEYDNFVESLDSSRDIEKILSDSGNKDLPSSDRDKAKGKIRKIGYDNGVNSGRIDPGTVSLDDIDYNFASGEAQDKQIIDSDRASKTLRDKLDDVIKGAPKKTLENMVGNKKSVGLLINASKDDGEVLSSYSAYVEAREFAKRYADSEEIHSEEEAKIATQALIDGVKQDQIERTRKAKLGSDAEERAAKLAEASVKLGYYKKEKSKEIVVKALERRADEIKKAYEKVVENTTKDWESAARSAYKKLVGDNFVLGRNILYGAAKEQIDGELAKMGIRQQ